MDTKTVAETYQVNEQTVSALADRPYLSMFFGPVYADENSPRVTGAAEVVINIEAGLEEDGFRIGLNYFHMSNGNLKSPNDGLDKILFGLTALF